MRRVALLFVSLLLLLWLWRDTDREGLVAVLTHLDPFWLGMAFLLFIPTTLVSALRWRSIAEALRPLSVAESLRMVLAASAANLFLPAKLGDVGKGAFLARDGEKGGRGEGLALAFVEKLIDVAALATLMGIASVGSPPVREAEQLALVLGLAVVTSFVVLFLVPLSGLAPEGSSGTLARAVHGVMALRSQPRRLVGVLSASLLLWGLHLFQFQCAAWAAGSEAAPAFLASRIPMAIFVGLLPISFAGIGTRDAAMVFLMAPEVGEPVALALGAFATLRYLVPAAAGMLSINTFDPANGS